MLGHGALVDALPAREPDALRLEQGTVVLVGSRTQRLHEAQSGRALQQMIAPQAGDDEHVRLGHARFQLLERAHLEAAQAGLAGGEGVLHAVGDVREADGDVGPAGQGGNGHAGSPCGALDQARTVESYSA